MRFFGIFFVGVLLLGSAAQARSIVFKLDCVGSNGQVNTDSEFTYQIIKSSSKDSGKWVNAFSLVESSHLNPTVPVVFQLQEESGDEGYLVYRAQDAGSEKFDWVKIGNKFQWATFSTSNSDFECPQAQ